MLVFPHWRPEMTSEGCRIQRWMPAERFAPYIAKPFAVPSAPINQVEDEDSSNSSYSERNEAGDVGEANVCGWRDCGLSFPSVARLSAHIARVHAHAHSSGLFYCGWKSCTRPQRGFNARYKMLVHVRTHTNERPHTCSQCSKSFSRAENLKIHLRSHSGEKPYVCPYEGCGKAYSNSSDRFKHTRTHTVDKPYCCKVSGCNKRYTDPSSLRKHVKTYKHFTPKEIARHESSDEKISPDYSPPRDTNYLEPTSPLEHKMPYSPQNVPPTYTPMVPMTETVPTPLRYSPLSLDRVTYLRPLEPVYPLRIPAHEMSYMEYTQMYEHTYRSYYSNSISYPVLTQNVCNKAFHYEQINDVEIEVSTRSPEIYSPIEDVPLNLKCMKRIEYTPIEDLVKRTDLPLDLSTKS